MDNIIFALDIGTRSVTGVLVEKATTEIRVVDYCMIEHNGRSMRDGQIHDVPAVAETIIQVKQQLEEKTGSPLKRVCIAAAGRALKTVEASASIDMRKYPIKSADDVKHLELSALQSAQAKLSTAQEADSYNNYYCVGYSLLYYKLDEERIGSLIDQKGNKASADIIATFLPKVVVESLLAAVSKAGLEVEAMTLEPIAALHILIPESMRRLNVVLVDIGAGTSDIAITDRGTVVSYGMVPVAGDEITEAVSDHYLLDFNEAERVKKELVENKRTEIEDILGFKTEITYEDMVAAIQNSIDQLSEVIAKEIQELNAKAPRAVMLVGGGSLTPEAPAVIAKKLDLPANRIAIRGVEAIQQLNTGPDFPGGPMFVTPIGIAITAKERPVQYITVHVNQVPVRLFEVNQVTVGDAIVQAGHEISRYYGKPGIASFITVNGKEITIPGKFGAPPVITLNGKNANVEEVVQDGDEIMIEQGADGSPASITLEELIGNMNSFEITHHGEHFVMGTICTVNGASQPPSYLVQDKDVIRWRTLTTVQDFLATYYPYKKFAASFPVKVNGEDVNLSVGGTRVLINNEEARMDRPLKDQDEVKVVDATAPTIKDLFREIGKSYFATIKVTFNDEPVELQRSAYSVQGKQGNLNINSAVERFDRITIKPTQDTGFVFQDVFRYVDIDLAKATGNFTLLCNKEKCAFDTPIHHGDQLAISWNRE